MDHEPEHPPTPGEAPGGSQGGGTGSAPRARPDALVRPALWFYAGLFALSWAICWWTDTSPFLHPATPRPGGVRPLWDAALGAVAGGLILALSDLLTRRTRSGAALADALAGLLGRVSPGACLVLALVSGVAEEAFFRGMLQPRIGLVAASAVFGLAHFVPRRDLAPWSLFASAAGLLFGVLFESTGNLLAPVVAHALVNAVNLFRLSRRPAASRGPGFDGGA